MLDYDQFLDFDEFKETLFETYMLSLKNAELTDRERALAEHYKSISLIFNSSLAKRLFREAREKGTVIKPRFSSDFIGVDYYV